LGKEAEPLITIESAIISTVVDVNKACIPQGNRVGSVPCFFRGILSPAIIPSPTEMPDGPVFS
jgi:hypothetical protein